MSKCKNIVITGANRGIGLKLVNQILTRFQPENVIATYRDEASSKSLLELASKHKNVHPLILDISKIETFEEFAKKVENITKGQGLNLLVNNAAIAQVETKLSDLEVDQLMHQFKVNCVAPVMLAKALLPQLEKASKAVSGPLGIRRAAIVNISTIVASLQENTYGAIYGYRISKTALNQATNNMSLELKEKGILVIPLHPGWVKTRLGGPNAEIEAIESADGILNVLEALDEKMTGRFMRWDGKEQPW